MQANERIIALIPTKYLTGNKYEVAGINKLIITCPKNYSHISRKLEG